MTRRRPTTQTGPLGGAPRPKRRPAVAAAEQPYGKVTSFGGFVLTFPHGCTQVSSVTPHGTHNGRFGPIWAVFRSEIDFSDPGGSSRCGAWRRRLTKSHIIHITFQSIRAAAHTDHTRPPAGPNTAKHSLGPETRRRPCARPRMSRSRPPAPFTPYHCARKSSAGGRSRGALSHSEPVHLRPPYMSTNAPPYANAPP